jgi:mycothiol synthase
VPEPNTDIRIETLDRIGPDDVAAITSLVSAAARADGVSPLSEHVLLHLRYGGDPRARNLLLTSAGTLAGYGHLDPTDPVAGPSGELVIHPEFRHRGLALTLLHALVKESSGRPLRLWAHGDLPGAGALAAAAGFHRVRALHQLRRPLAAPVPEPSVAKGFSVRTFAVGQDEDAWLEVNARAFAHHPEQGAWTRQDLDQREREPWFDPEGFFLAERDGQLAGFHWTKIHGSQRPDPGEQSQDGHGHDPIGEVYVVGVDPSAQGSGLGRALTLIGLRYLRSRGLPDVMLYVDDDNTSAVHMYESLGFTHWHTDVMFSNSAGISEVNG